MAKTTRQTAIFGVEDWKALYKTYKEADFQSYNFETIRKTFIDYLRQHHPETFNDFTEHSEYIALLNLMATMGQALSFRSDLNTRENFMDLAERQDSVNHLSSLVSYTTKRNEPASGFLKISAVSTTENIIDFNRNSLSNLSIRWNDKTNEDWQEQFTAVINAALVSSQKVGNPNRTATILGVRTDEYELNMNSGVLPIIPFNATVDDVAMNFEIVNSTSVGEDFIYEPAPKLNGPLNLLYRNDNGGFASANTGYFFFFKQGSLQTNDFSLSERVANTNIDVNIDGINNNDVWLYKIDTDNNVVSDLWSEVANIYASNGNTSDRKYFSISSRANDQITLNFGDGVFSEIPVGSFRVYARKSNGLSYVINPEEIQNIDIAFDYISRYGRKETMTMTLNLMSPVTNAQEREALDDIKRRAPARWYTQNRMVNGEDYNNFPYTEYGSIIKNKSINRTNIGSSRYLDLLDPTGKYSTINTFGSDGLLYKTFADETFTFTFNNKNDIASVFANQVEPILASRVMTHYYHATYSRVDIASENLGISWVQKTTTTNETTGYFQNVAGDPMQVGSLIGGSRQYISENALIKFKAPTGTYFDINNKLVSGNVATGSNKEYIWATIKSVELDGTSQGEAHILSGPGPVIINDFVPTNAIPVEIIPAFNSDLPTALEQSMIDEIILNRNFGLKYDHLTNTWSLILQANLSTEPWIIKFEATESEYVVTYKTLHYYFSSVLETRFFYDKNRQIFDPKTGKVVNDFIRVLKSNTKPDATNNPLARDVTLDIIDQSVESDGFVNDFKVEISFTDDDKDGIADDPDFFDTLVNSTSLVFFQSVIDFDNLERFLPVAENSVNTNFAIVDDIEAVKTEFADGQLFYTTTDKLFYELQINGSIRSIVERTDMKTELGRGDLFFQYKHNSPNTSRINPSITNIIDMYVVTSSYYDEYLKYVQDSTNTIEEPLAPSSDDLSNQYGSLKNSGMVSDNIILNSVKFKPLFGDKADKTLQAYIKVVKLNNVLISDSEIKSRVVAAMNKYFDIDNWSFGDKFYFSELAAYLHAELGDVIGSVVIVSKNSNQVFGDLYEIRSEPSEIFVNAATVNDVVIIDALTASKLQFGE